MTTTPSASSFDPSRGRFESIVGILESEKAMYFPHTELETLLHAESNQLMRMLFQDHLELRADREPRIQGIIDAQGIPRNSVEYNAKRTLTMRFGDVQVRRIAYRRHGHFPNLYPADAILNLPNEQYSLGLRRLVAEECIRGSFEGVVGAVERETGVRLGKRQVEELTLRAAVDFESFYAKLPHSQAKPNDVLVLSVDGKGINMLPDALRDATAKTARSTVPSTKMSKAEEKPAHKRMAEVGVVYYATPVPRTPEDILSPRDKASGRAKPAPVAKNKWLTASIVEDAATVISQVFAESQRRDPEHSRTWVVLVDGNNHQINCIRAEARKRKVKVHIVIDYIHVIGYVWGAAHSFFDYNDPRAKAWVEEKAASILAGEAGLVAGAIKRKATCLKLSRAKREGADKCNTYLKNKQPYLNYRLALEQGWPIATGPIEGACRYLIKDRFDITGARWGLGGAEAVLKLRALGKNDDFEGYWRYHIVQERRRIHEARYAGGTIPGLT